MVRRPPGFTLTSTPVPYTTLSRSPRITRARPLSIGESFVDLGPCTFCNDVLMTTQNPIRSLGERSSLFLISHKGGVILKNVFLFIPSDQPRVNCLINQPTGKLEICQVNQGIHPTVTIEEKLVSRLVEIFLHMIQMTTRDRDRKSNRLNSS